MEKQQLADDFRDFFALVADLRQERGELKLKMHLTRCGIQQEWEKSESKWQRLQAAKDFSSDSTRQLAQEVKDSYIRIYRGLLMKSSKFLAQLNGIGQSAEPEKNAQLEILKRQVVEEGKAISRKFATLGAAASTTAEEEPVCACLKCRQDTGKQPLNPGQVQHQRAG
jgi:hypothetical protein